MTPHDPMDLTAEYLRRQREEQEAAEAARAAAQQHEPPTQPLNLGEAGTPGATPGSTTEGTPQSPYQAPQYGGGQYGAPQYGSGQYGAPEYGTPQYGAPQYAHGQYGSPQGYGPPQPVPPSLGSAQTSMVLGIIGLAGMVVCGPFSLVFSPFAWALGSSSLKTIRASNGTLGGEGAATTGRMTGIIGTVVLALAVLALIAFVALIVAADPVIEENSSVGISV